MSGYWLPRYLSLKTFTAKTVGLTSALAAGFVIGKVRVRVNPNPKVRVRVNPNPNPNPNPNTLTLTLALALTLIP